MSDLVYHEFRKYYEYAKADDSCEFFRSSCEEFCCEDHTVEDCMSEGCYCLENGKLPCLLCPIWMGEFNYEDLPNILDNMDSIVTEQLTSKVKIKNIWGEISAPSEEAKSFDEMFIKVIEEQKEKMASEKAKLFHEKKKDAMKAIYASIIDFGVKDTNELMAEPRVDNNKCSYTISKINWSLKEDD